MQIRKLFLAALLILTALFPIALSPAPARAQSAALLDLVPVKFAHTTPSGIVEYDTCRVCVACYQNPQANFGSRTFTDDTTSAVDLSKWYNPGGNSQPATALCHAGRLVFQLVDGDSISMAVDSLLITIPEFSQDKKKWTIGTSISAGLAGLSPPTGFANTQLVWAFLDWDADANNTQLAMHWRYVRWRFRFDADIVTNKTITKAWYAYPRSVAVGTLN